MKRRTNRPRTYGGGFDELDQAGPAKGLVTGAPAATILALAGHQGRLSAREVTAETSGYGQTKVRTALKQLVDGGYVRTWRSREGFNTRALMYEPTEKGLELAQEIQRQAGMATVEAFEDALADTSFDPASWGKEPVTHAKSAITYDVVPSDLGGVVVEAYDTVAAKRVGRLEIAPSGLEVDEDRTFGKFKPGDYAPVVSVRVHPAYRRQGVGTKLYERAAHEAAKMGLPLASLDDRTRGDGAFWRKQQRKGRAVMARTRKWPSASRYVLDFPPPAALNPAGDERLRALERAAAQGDRAAQVALERELRRRGPECESCGGLATHDWEGTGLYCWPCIESMMEHGHDNVHDYSDDCHTTAKRLDGSEIVDTYTCPSPRSDDDDDDDDEDDDEAGGYYHAENPRARRRNPDPDLRELERRALAGDAAAAQAFQSALTRVGRHPLRVPHPVQGYPRVPVPRSLVFGIYPPIGWYVVGSDGTWSRQRWGTADEAMAAAMGAEAMTTAGDLVARRRNPGGAPQSLRIPADASVTTRTTITVKREPHGRKRTHRNPPLDMLERTLRNTLGKAGWQVLRGTHGQVIVGRADGHGYFRADAMRVDAFADGADVVLQIRAPGQRAHEIRMPGELAATKRVREIFAHTRSNPPLLAMGVGALPVGLLNPRDEFGDKKGPGEEGDGPRAKELQPRFNETKVSLEEARRLLIEQHGPREGERLFRAALDRAQLFHGRKPAGTAPAITIDDGKPGHEFKVVVGLGKVPETHYVTPWPSNKKGYHWIHHHPKGKEPLEVLDPETGWTMKIGGSYRVTDWWRK